MAVFEKHVFQDFAKVSFNGGDGTPILKVLLKRCTSKYTDDLKNIFYRS